ncbi:hypothetical protein LTR53_009920 [Teratosphaeriaceae sp. CCFEE 6253]|nr:hypothetical protein LTR53_009920 [Teratosphaeriaceae sp. CCFEE 6253]
MAVDGFPKSFGLLLYPQFEVLDVAGPIETLNTLARLKIKDDNGQDKQPFAEITLSIIAKTWAPVTPGPIAPDTAGVNFSGRQLYCPTHTFDNAPQVDFLLVPGGFGSLSPLPGGAEADVDDAIAYIQRAYRGCDGCKPLNYLMSVCTGAALLARAGVLDHQEATTNKQAWRYVTPLGTKTYWKADARWVVSGNIWSTSGVSAGTDGMIAWLSHMLPDKIVEQVVNSMEYNRVSDPADDPFCKVNDCHDVPPLEDD